MVRYLGSIITNTGSCDKEVKTCIGKACSAFKRLDGIRCQKCLGLPLKIRLYESLMLAVLLYYVETWPITEANRKRLEGFHYNCLRRILNISWKDKVKNESVSRKTNSHCQNVHFNKRRLRRFGLAPYTTIAAISVGVWQLLSRSRGHVQRMENQSCQTSTTLDTS